MSKVLSQEKIQARTYRHFSLPTAAPVPAGRTGTEFFYLGSDASLIDVLIESFESGYASDNTEEARGILRRMIARTGSGPDVIIAAAETGFQTLALFQIFLQSTPQLANLPFLIEGSRLGQEELNRYRTIPFADDIVDIAEIGSKKLAEKVRFWKRIKEKSASQPVPAVEEHLSDPSLNVQHLSKRLFDIFISVTLMIVLSPVFLLVILALKIESNGPVFYVSKRAGKGYRIFNFYKFRTMVASATDQINDLTHLNLYNPLRPDGPMFIKIDNDPRITRLGAFLRKCSLDELPQLWNVFLGDMSLVGNRPLPLYEAATLTTDEWAKRFMAPAGITGLWQVKKKKQFRMTAEERIRLDIRYAERASLLYDLWIMAHTPAAAIQRTNA